MSSTMMAAEPTQARRSGRFRKLLPLSLRAHAVYFLFLLLYVGIGGAVVSQYEAVPFDIGSAVRSFFLVYLPILFLAVVTLRFAHLIAHVRPDRPTLALIRDLRAFLSDPVRMAGGIAMTLAMFVFMKAFLAFKADIPGVNPFSWDESFAALDAWLHFGRQPWEWLQPVLGYAPVTFAINICYNLWFMEMWLMWTAFAFAAMPSVLRTRFFVTFMLIWSIGGNVLATVFSSAGPIFYPELGLDTAPYSGLISYLYGVNDRIELWALDTKDLLWLSYETKQDIVSGISAMPSMHNASALLFALAGMKLNRRLGIALYVYAGLIFFGSIHLGWHYAADAYLGFALTLVCWWAAGRFAVWYERLPWPRAYRAAIEERQVASEVPEGLRAPA